jgi:hypothetical protein
MRSKLAMLHEVTPERRVLEKPTYRYSKNFLPLLEHKVHYHPYKN